MGQVAHEVSLHHSELCARLVQSGPNEKSHPVATVKRAIFFRPGLPILRHQLRMTDWNRVVIYGVGMLGGSIGHSIRQRGMANQVIGFGRNEQNLIQAKQLGAIDRYELDPSRAFADSDLVIVCTPVQIIPKNIAEIWELCGPQTLLTDVGSTKAEIVKQVTKLNRKKDGREFLASHPIAGSEKSGPSALVPDLLVNRKVILTPSKSNSAKAVQRLTKFWEKLGAIVTQLSPEKHDKVFGEISHLPHLVASLLASVTNSKFIEYSGAGWGDSTRIAASDPELWIQIFKQNQPAVLEGLERFIRECNVARDALVSEDWQSLIKILKTGKRKRDSVGS